MTAEFKKLLNNIDKKKMFVPENLASNIILRVDTKIKQNAKLKALGLSFVSMCSLFISIPIIFQIITSFTQSGFYNYLSIIFSDSDVAIIYWKEILMSLVESLPIVGIVGLLAVTLVFVWSILKATSVAKNALMMTA